MGRTKTYNRIDVLRKAMTLFWQKGYGATSISELEKHIPINRYSLFAEFGSKKELFEAALGLYQEEVVTSYLASVEKEGASLADLRELLASFAVRAQSKEAYMGCLNCNTATEFGSVDHASRKYVDYHIQRLTNVVTTALRNARQAGEISAATDVENEGRTIATAILGLFVILRSQSNGTIAEGMIGSLNYQLDRLVSAEMQQK